MIRSLCCRIRDLVDEPIQLAPIALNDKQLADMALIAEQLVQKTVPVVSEGDGGRRSLDMAVSRYALTTAGRSEGECDQRPDHALRSIVGDGSWNRRYRLPFQSLPGTHQSVSECVRPVHSPSPPQTEDRRQSALPISA